MKTDAFKIFRWINTHLKFSIFESSVVVFVVFFYAKEAILLCHPK